MSDDAVEAERLPISYEKRSIPSATEGDGWFQDQWSRGVLAITKGSNEVLFDSLLSISRQLAKYKRNNSPEDWVSLLALARAHPLYEVMLLDPFVKEARELTHPILAEPQLLDYLYGAVRPRKKTPVVDPLGKKIFNYSAVTKRSRAIRQMRLSIAEEVMMTASANHGARILSIGSGYLRELDAVPWHSQLDIEIFLAIDRSHEITSRVRYLSHHERIKAITGHLWELARFGIVLDGFSQNDFHLIYSVGAMDSLDEFTAEKLIVRLVSALAPGGRLVLYNSRPLTADIAFQEAFVGQRPFSRNRTEIDLLLRPIRTQREFSLRIDDAEADEFTRITIERLRIC